MHRTIDRTLPTVDSTQQPLTKESMPNLYARSALADFFQTLTELLVHSAVTSSVKTVTVQGATNVSRDIVLTMTILAESVSPITATSLILTLLL